MLVPVLIFLLAAAIAVPLFTRFRLGAVLAYLAAGAVLGPHALGWLETGEAGAQLGELGVVLLLFVIGLEVSATRLWLMRRAVFVVGLLQVVLTTVLVAALLLALGLELRSAAVAGFALSMSSTAIGVQLLAERHELPHAHGRTALAVLLFQDLVAIPAIALLPLFGAAAAAEALDARAAIAGLLQVIGAVAAVLVVSRFLVRPLFRYVARTRSVEAFTATTLLVALGTAYLTASAGISMAIGAFLAGLMLSDSEYRHEIEANLEPFKGLLLGVFFVAVGVTVDWRMIGANAAPVLLGVLALVTIKAAVLYGLGRASRLDRDDAARLAVVLCQGGEFAFVLLALAAQSALLDPALRDQMTATVVLSMALTPLLVLGLDRYRAGAARRGDARPYDEIPADERPRVIIAGFGRVGQIVARVLRAQRVPFVALEHSVEQVETSRRFGSKIYYGDPARAELLRAAGAEHAEVFVLATDDPETNVRVARLVKRQFPRLRIYARARNRQHAYRLMDLQVATVVRETFHSSLEIARDVLEGLGLPRDEAAARVARFRAHDEALLESQYAFYDDESKLVQTSQEAQAELEQLFEADRREGPQVASVE
ncbi:MAG TPA: monovalent cation:proton antiporter-2 (CPA2) family protein [Candidatus Saccharimonadia bacterium]|nr:monovalent cation:proton antiporter-2 (CPA2) family protein [Candidatus Saccharimonadia bacterium]